MAHCLAGIDLGTCDRRRRIIVNIQLPHQLALCRSLYRNRMRIFLSVFLDIELRHFHYRAHDVYRCSSLGLQVFKLSIEPLLGDAALVVAVLPLVHCELEKLLLVLTLVPAFVLHHLAELRQLVRVHVLRVAGVEFHVLFLRQVNDFRRKRSRKLSHAAQNHAPSVLVNGGPPRLAVEDVQQVHEGGILHILAERCYQRRVAQSRPNVLYFFEQLDHQCVQTDFRTSVGAF